MSHQLVLVMVRGVHAKKKRPDTVENRDRENERRTAAAVNFSRRRSVTRMRLTAETFVDRPRSLHRIRRSESFYMVFSCRLSFPSTPETERETWRYVRVKSRQHWDAIYTHQGPEPLEEAKLEELKQLTPKA